jgi:putative membrane protein
MIPSNRTLVAGVALALAALSCQKQAVGPAVATAPPPPAPEKVDPQARKTLVMPVSLMPENATSTTSSEPNNATAAARKGGPSGTPAASGASPSDTETLRDQGAITDDEIVAASEAVHAAQVEQGTLARAKAKEPRLREFADKLKADHERARRDGKSLAARLAIKPKESPLSSELGADAAGATKTLKNAKRSEFDRLFVESQIAAQQKTLKLLDQKLIPSARNQDLKTLLEGLRATIQAHLEEARGLQASASASAR